ncbi:lysozyme C [Engraulis encrasicolus]|uniref:lysozyme C n=1 Tax=Engraulis encrasicolus TaxID=184585 RepID=UPI002FD78894
MRTLMLASLAVVAMVSTVVVDGAMVTKCEVKDHIEGLLSKTTPEERENMTITMDKLTAIITCHVELTSGFNTSAVNLLPVPDVGGGAGVRWTPADVWTLYGIFQLPGSVICNSGMGTSLNLCAMDCSKLVDDNIDDDIKCVESLKAKEIKTLFPRECWAVTYDEYFAECS